MRDDLRDVSREVINTRREGGGETVRVAKGGVAKKGKDVKAALEDGDEGGFLLAKFGITSTVLTAPSNHYSLVAVRNPVDAESITLYAKDTGTGGGTDTISRVGVATVVLPSLPSFNDFKTSGVQPSSPSITNPHSITLSAGKQVLLGENGAAWEVIAVLGGDSGGSAVLHGLVFTTIAGATAYNLTNNNYTPTIAGSLKPLDRSSIPWTVGTEITTIEWAGSSDIVGSSSDPVLVKYHMEGAVAVIDSQDTCCGEV